VVVYKFGSACRGFATTVTDPKDHRQTRSATIWTPGETTVYGFFKSVCLFTTSCMCSFLPHGSRRVCLKTPTAREEQKHRSQFTQAMAPPWNRCHSLGDGRQCRRSSKDASRRNSAGSVNKQRRLRHAGVPRNSTHYTTGRQAGGDEQRRQQ
jgi:hypothetical protein